MFGEDWIKQKTALRREGRSGCKEEAKNRRTLTIPSIISASFFFLKKSFCLHSSKPPSTVSELACEKFSVLALLPSSLVEKKIQYLLNKWLAARSWHSNGHEKQFHARESTRASVYSLLSRLGLLSCHVISLVMTRQCLSSGSEHFFSAHANVQRLQEEKRGSRLIEVLGEHEKLCVKRLRVEASGGGFCSSLESLQSQLVRWQHFTHTLLPKSHVFEDISFDHIVTAFRIQRSLNFQSCPFSKTFH